MSCQKKPQNKLLQYCTRNAEESRLEICFILSLLSLERPETTAANQAVFIALKLPQVTKSSTTKFPGA